MKPFPQPLSLRKLIGPSFIILALGLGSGEVILWPYLVSNHGLGIAWGAIVGITFQYFINMEIERYALVKGESVFVGLYRLFPRVPYWFILSTFVGFGLPGIVAASAHAFSHMIGLTDFKWTAMAFLVFIGIILSSGKTVYGLMEKLTKTIILLGVPFIFVLAVIMSVGADWVALLKGIVGQGDGFRFLPEGISLATFFAAFAYSGAGGNLNLTQSIYVKEKGYGMGAYAQKIAGLFARGGARQEIKLTGESFEENPENISRFKRWWRLVSIEHLFVFWFLGTISILLLMLLSYSSAYGEEGNAQGIQFVLNQGAAIGQRIFPIAGKLFLLVVGVMLFQTQLGVMDSTSRIMAENYALKKLGARLEGSINLSKIYYIFLWLQIAFGVILFLFNVYEPKSLIVLGALINAFAMFVHIGLVFLLNRRSLAPVFQASVVRRAILILIFIFFGLFSGYVLLDAIR